MNRTRKQQASDFRSHYREADSYLLKPDSKNGRPGLFEAFGENDEPVLVKVWPRRRGVEDSDLQQIWQHELRQLHRLGGYPGAVDTIAPLQNSGMDEKGFYLVLDPGQRRPLQVLLDRESPNTIGLRNPRTASARSRMWRNLKRVAFGLETLHAQGLLHRNLDNYSILTSGGDYPDFLLTGFEWSMRVVGGRSGQRTKNAKSEPDSFFHDWVQFGKLAANLFKVDSKRLADLSIPPFTVSDHLSAAEMRLLRDLHRLDFDDHIDGEIVGRRIDELVESLNAESAIREAKLHLVFRIGGQSPLVERIRLEDPSIETDDLIALFDWIRSDLTDRPLLMVLKAFNPSDENRLVLRGHKLCYTLRPFQDRHDSVPSWEFAFCEATEKTDPAAVNVIGQRVVSSETIELMTLREGRERFPRLRGKLRDWGELRRSFEQIAEPRSREIETLQALVMTQFLETLFAAAEVFPIEIVTAPDDMKNEESMLYVRTRADPEREDLARALGLKSQGRRLHDALAGDGLRREGWTLTDSKLLGEQQPTDTEWKFERVVKTENGRNIYEFTGPLPQESGSEVFLVPSDSIGRDIQFKRRLKAMRSLADHSELLKMIGDRRARLLDSHERITKDDAYELLDSSKQSAINEMIEILPLYLVQGPPGVGKTFLVRELAARRFREDSTVRILLTAQSNAALDHLLSELAPAITGVEEAPLIVRCRPRDSVAPRSPYDLDEQAKKILENFIGSKVAIESNAQLRRKLVTLAQGDKDRQRSATNSSYQSPAMALRTFEGVVVRSANFVFATTNSAELERMIEEKSQFDWSIVEEAGKATGGELISPQLLSHRRLMIGDHKQLPPFGSDQMTELLKQPEKVEAALRIGQELVGRTLRDEVTDEMLDQLEEADDIPALCGRALGLVTLFETMIEEELTRQNAGHGRRPIAKRLLQQHRMHPIIAKLVSKCFYQGELETHSSCVKRFETEDRPFRSVNPDLIPETPITVIDMPALQSTIGKKSGDRHPRWHNPEEVDAVMAVVRGICANEDNKPTLAILSPYLQQVKKLRNAVDLLDEEASPLSAFRPATQENRFVETVDSFQGSEADLVIVSLVRNNDHSNVRSALGFLSDYRRMNVLLSRARWQMIIIGSLDFMREIVDAAMGTDDEIKIEFLKQLLSELDDGAEAGQISIVPAATIGIGS